MRKDLFGWFFSEEEEEYFLSQPLVLQSLPLRPTSSLELPACLRRPEIEKIKIQIIADQNQSVSQPRLAGWLECFTGDKLPAPPGQAKPELEEKLIILHHHPQCERQPQLMLFRKLSLLCLPQWMTRDVSSGPKGWQRLLNFAPPGRLRRENCQVWMVSSPPVHICQSTSEQYTFIPTRKIPCQSDRGWLEDFINSNFSLRF